MTNKRSKKKEEKPEQTGKIEVVLDEALLIPDGPIFVPDNVKLERVKKQLRADRIVKDRIILDFWLRHELQLGTGQIRKLWSKMDEVYR